MQCVTVSAGRCSGEEQVPARLDAVARVHIMPAILYVLLLQAVCESDAGWWST
jgi:hypothetical protein